jgi:hypothetical protein
MDEKEREEKRTALREALLALVKYPTHSTAERVIVCVEEVIETKITEPWAQTEL